MSQNRNLIYLASHNSFFDKIIESKRLQILNIIKDLIKNIKIKDALDIGTTGDEENKSSNLITLKKPSRCSFLFKTLSACSTLLSLTSILITTSKKWN